MATIPRLFVHADLSAGASVQLDAEQSHYLTRVLRLGGGAALHVFNGRDGEWSAVIEGVSGKHAALAIRAQRREQPQTAAHLSLAFSPLKKTRTDFIVEKATELGVSLIQPVITARTQSARVRADRLQKIALEAAEQTERLDVPDVRSSLSLAAFLEGANRRHTLFFCDEAGDAPGEKWGGEGGRAQPMLRALEAAGPGPGLATILVGPEGGFTPEERASLRALDFVMPVTLGQNILRAETAVVSALTLWQAVLGVWR